MMRIRAGAVVFAIVTIAATACTRAENTDDATPQAQEVGCDEVTPAFTEAFKGLQSGRRAVPICVADVGPGLEAPDLAAEFSSVVAGHVKNAERMTGTDLDLLGVLVGTLKSGTGEDFVARLFSRLGPDATNGTARIADRTMQFIDLRPGGPRGYAYGKGEKVVIAYARSPLGPPSHPLMALEITEAVADILPGNTVGSDPSPTAPADDGIADWPLAHGNFSSPTDPGWVYFRTDGEGVAEIHCGISPNGSMVGCDFARTPYGAPEGTNQLILDGWGLRYAQSRMPTFTRPDVDIVWIGERVENGPAACRVTDQAPLFCRVVSTDGTAERALFK